jgi:hypothetical protein
LNFPHINIINGKPTVITSKDTKRLPSKATLKDKLKAKRQELFDLYTQSNEQIEKLLNEGEFETSKEFTKEFNKRLKKMEQKVQRLSARYSDAYNLIQSGIVTTDSIQRERELGVEYSKAFQEYTNVQEKLLSFKGALKNVKEKSAKLKQEIGQLEYDLMAISSKAVENDLILGIWDILSDPANYIRLITPNSTNIAQPKADSMRSIFEKLGIGYNPRLGWKKIKGGTAKVLSKISPTKVLTPVFNNHIHEVNSVSKDVLGVGAVDNTFNAILNRVGAYLNPFYDLYFDSATYLRSSYKQKPKNFKTAAEIFDEKFIKKISKISADEPGKFETALYDELKRLNAIIYSVEEKKGKRAPELRKFRTQKRTLEIALARKKRIKILLPHNKMKVNKADVVSLSHLMDANNKYEIG